MDPMYVTIAAAVAASAGMLASTMWFLRLERKIDELDADTATMLARLAADQARNQKSIGELYAWMENLREQMPQIKI